MWRHPSLFLVAVVLSVGAASAQVISPPAAQPEATPAPVATAPATATPPAPVLPAAPLPAANESPSQAAPSVTIQLTPPPEPAKAEPTANIDIAPATTPGPQTPVAAPLATPAPKPPKAKAKPKLVPVAPPADEMDEPVTAARGGSSQKPPSFRCFVRDVMAFYDRTHLRCYNKARGKVFFFAVDTAQPIAATVLAKALNGMQLGKPVTVTYAPGSDLNPSNCDIKNCRRLLDIKN